MKLELRPWRTTARSVISKLFVNGVYECFVLEEQPPAVPADTYEIKIFPSARFGRPMPFLLDVPGHVGIEIHPGNIAADTRGCLLVGLTEGPDAVLESRAAFDALFAKLEGTNPITIEVSRPIPSIPPESPPQAIPPVVTEGVLQMADPTPAVPATSSKLALTNHAPVTASLVAGAATSILIALAKAKLGLDLSGQEGNLVLLIGALVGYLTKGAIE